jgi:hypothetical protein
MLAYNVCVLLASCISFWAKLYQMHEHLLASKCAFRVLVCKRATSGEGGEKARSRRGIWVRWMRNTTYITRGNRKLYVSEGSQAVPARPYGKGGLWQGRSLGSGLLNYATRERRLEFDFNFECGCIMTKYWSLPFVWITRMYRNLLRTSQRTWSMSTAKTCRLMLFGVTRCENHKYSAV